LKFLINKAMKKRNQILVRIIIFITVLIATLTIISSCTSTRSLEHRRERKCEKAAFKWGCDWGHDTAYIRETVTNTVYRDTLVYIYLHGETKTDSVPVYVTVYKDGTFSVTTKKSILQTSLAKSEAWIENGKLRHTITQKDSAYQALIKNAVRITVSKSKEVFSQTKTKVEYVRVNKWYDKPLRFLGICALAYMVYVIYKGYKRLYPNN